MYCTEGPSRKKEWHQSDQSSSTVSKHGSFPVITASKNEKSFPTSSPNYIPPFSSPAPLFSHPPSLSCFSSTLPPSLRSLPRFSTHPSLYFCMSHCSSRTMEGSDLAASLNSSRVISSLWSLSILEKILSTRCCGVSPSSFIRIMITVPTIL